MSLQKPSRRSILLELVRRKRIKKAILRELHSRQRKVAKDRSRNIALLCSRRAGKTELCARLIALALLESGHNEWVVYTARTKSIARDLIWAHLVKLNEDHRLGWVMHENTGNIKTPTGAQFLLLGVDKRAEVEKLRGYKIRLIIADEASTYQDHLQHLVTAVEPALSDLAGRLILSGTPGVVCDGYWFSASTGAKPKNAGRLWRAKYKIHHWTVRQNPLFPRDVDEMLREVREDNGWDEEDATYRREYLGEWVEDTSALVYKFTRDRNTCEVLPEEFDKSTWLCTLGVDFGMTDECAWVVLGSPKHSRQVFVLHAEKHSEMLPDEAAALTAELVERFKPVRIVGDGGGLGKPYIVEFNRRWAHDAGISVSLAEKADKVGTISLLNGDLRAAEGRPPLVKLLLPAAEELAREIQHLPWLDAAHTKENPSFPNHCADAFLYAWRSHSSYWNRPKKKEPTRAEIELAARRERARRAREGKREWHKGPRADVLPLAA